MNKKNAYKWNAGDYANHSSAQQSWAKELMGKLALTGGESVLDIGCGDGKITAKIAKLLPHGHIIGIDSSSDMIGLAKKRYPSMTYPNLSFEVADAAALPFHDRFDVVFSNAALHWIIDHTPVLKGIKNCLTRKGRILLQMGGKGNASGIFEVLNTLMKKPLWQSCFRNFSFPYGFYDPEEYEVWLQQAGLTPQRVELIPKIMSYDNTEGLAGWIRTTWLPYTEPLPKDLKEPFITQLADLYIKRYPLDQNGMVHVNMMRLEVQATQC